MEGTGGTVVGCVTEVQVECVCGRHTAPVSLDGRYEWICRTEYVLWVRMFGSLEERGVKEADVVPQHATDDQQLV